jgi:hypothetical protein
LQAVPQILRLPFKGLQHKLLELSEGA